MSNWILTAKSDVSSPIRGRSGASVTPKDLKKGFTLTVAAPSTGGPAHKDVIGALILAGFCKEEAEHYDNSSWTYYFEGKECGELDAKLDDRQHKAYCKRDKYSAFNSTNEKRDKAEKEAKKDRQKDKEKKGCCPSSSLCNSICNSIIDSIPGLRCIVDCCC